MEASRAHVAAMACLTALLALVPAGQVARGQDAAPAPILGEEIQLYEPLDPTGLFYDPFAPGEAPVVLLSCDPLAETGVLATQYGVLHGDVSRAVCVPRVGVGGVFGTHNSGVDARAGVAGVVPIVKNHYGDDVRLTYDVLGAAAAIHRQWGYNFAGTETRLSVEVVGELPLLYDYLPSLLDVGRRYQMHPAVGYRLSWFDNNSYDQINGRPTTAETNYDILSQRLATLFVQLDFTTDGSFVPGAGACPTLHRLRFEFENDSVLGGDRGDEFRTHTSRLLYLGQSGSCQLRVGLILELFTGQVDLSEIVVQPDGEFFDTTGLLFNDRSMGFFGFQLGGSWFHHVGCHHGELGVNFTLGADNEAIRDTFQNELVHQRILGIPQVPRVDREDRIRFDVGVFYILHF